MIRIMFSVLLLITVPRLHGQGIAELKAAIDNPQKKVQAIHHYPENIKDGECHFVEVTAITVSGDHITIVEQWSNWRGKKATTTLTGRIVNNVATGEWKSDYSSGNWSYNFSNNTGTWNKTSAPLRFGTFREWHKIDFTIVGNDAVKDNFFECKVR